MRSPSFRLILAILIGPSNLCLAQLAPRLTPIARTQKASLRAPAGATASQTNRPRIKRPLLAPIDQSTQAPLVSNVRPGFEVELWVGNSRIATSAPVPSGATLTCLIVGLFLVASGTVGAQETADPVVDAIFADLTKPGSPGCALGIYRDGKVIYAKDMVLRI